MVRFVNAPSIQNFVNAAVNRVRYFLGFDSVLNTYGQLSTLFQPAGDFKAKIEFSTTSSSAQTLFGGELAGTDEIKLEINTSGYAVASAYVGTALQTAITSSVALDNGKLNSAEIVYTGTTAEFFVNNVSIGTQTWALNGSQTIKYFGRLSTGTYFHGVPANPTLTDVATPTNSQAYRLDRPTGTTEISLVNTGTLTYYNLPEANRFPAQLVGLDWFGNEEVVNGNFATDTVWVKDSRWAIAGGSAIATQGAGFDYLTQASVDLTEGAIYKSSYDISNYSGSGNFGFSSTIFDGGLISANGNFTANLEAKGGDFRLFSESGSGGSLDNVSTKRILEAP
jgi:hypothetical protein